MERLVIYDIEEDPVLYQDINISKYFEFYEAFGFQSIKCKFEEDNLSNSNYEFLFNNLNENNKKEYFYIKAIKNLIKQRDFLTLINQYDNNLIDESEFSFEIENHSEKYSIDVDEILNYDNVKVLSKIIENLNIELHEGDITEIFSINIFDKKVIINTSKMD